MDARKMDSRKMDSRLRDLVAIGDSLFGSRQSLLSYWQEVAENFYPERADFTVRRSPGDDPWAGLMTSEPILVRRELANTLQAMLRPDGADWFAIHLMDERLDNDGEARRWLEWMTRVQKRAMYHPPAQFKRATKEGDNDWVTFGQAVIEVDLSPARASLLYRTGHLRDHAWSENAAGAIDMVHRKWHPTARQLAALFPATVDPRVAEAAKREPEKAIACRRIVLPAADWDFAEPAKRRRRSRESGYVSLTIDLDNDRCLEETPLAWMPYVIPRWQTVSGSQYAWSPCTGPGLADARTLQSLVRVLLEAGEKAVDPPMVAVQEALRSDVALYAGGVTWVDIEYDERLGEALRPVGESRGLPVGLDMAERLRGVLAEGFFINKLTLPQDVGRMTAYEVAKRLEEFIRSSAPLLSPAEDEYNAPLCERSFEALRAMKAFGPEDEIPPALQGREMQFVFASPMRELGEEVKAQKLAQGMQGVIGLVAGADPLQVKNVDLTEATRDSLKGLGWPAKWLAPEDAVEKARQEEAAAAEAAQMASAVGATAFTHRV